MKVLVLDEADRLLAMGFRKDIERIIAAIPKQRQTLLFSATVPQEVSFFIPSVYLILMFQKFEGNSEVANWCEGPSNLPCCIEKRS